MIRHFINDLFGIQLWHELTPLGRVLLWLPCVVIIAVYLGLHIPILAIEMLMDWLNPAYQGWRRHIWK